MASRDAKTVSASSTEGVTVAVIGAGPSGLSMLKTLREDGFSATLFERRDRVGGLWAYTPDPSMTTALPITRANISKYTCGFSDFEMPEHYPDYMSVDHFQEYMQSYAEHFGLLDHIVLSRTVKRVTRNKDDSKWVLEVEPTPAWKSESDNAGSSTTTGDKIAAPVSVGDKVAIPQQATAPTTLEFDKVVFCHGYQTKAKMPTFEGQELFEGTIMHSQQYRGAEPFANKTVVVLGLGSSAGDVIPDLARVAKRPVYAAHRRGAMIFKRRADNGTPNDLQITRAKRQLSFFLTRYFPNAATWIADKGAGLVLARAWAKSEVEVEEEVPEDGGAGATDENGNAETPRKTTRTVKRKLGAFDPSWRLTPFPSITATLPSSAEEVIPLLASGKVRSMHGLKRFLGPKSVEFDDGTVLDDVDAVVCCTGYRADWSPVLGEAWLEWSAPAAEGVAAPAVPSIPRLYMNLFPPRHATSLALLCFSAYGKSNGFSFADVTSCAVSNVFRGAHALPPLAEMERHVTAHQAWVASRWRLAPGGGVDVSLVRQWEWQTWLHGAAGTGMDENLSWLGWRGWWFFARDPRLAWLMNHGVETAHAYRFFDTGKRPRWDGARMAVLRANELVRGRWK